MRVTTAFILALLAGCAVAATYTVDDDGPADFNSIQVAVHSTDVNDIIIVYPGRYVESIHMGDLFHHTIRSIDPNDPCAVLNTIIDGNNAGPFMSLDPETRLVLKGFLIINGNTNSPMFRFGGAIYSRGELQVENCVFINNKSEYGGAIYRYEGGLTITNCLFSRNSASWYGGAIHCEYTSPIIINCTFSNNSAGNSGGALYGIYDCNATVTNCTFSGNSSAILGGAVYFARNSYPRIANCTFIANHSETGGAVRCWTYSHATFVNSILWANAAGTGSQIGLSLSSIDVSFCDVQAGQSEVSLERDSYFNWGPAISMPTLALLTPVIGTRTEHPPT